MLEMFVKLTELCAMTLGIHSSEPNGWAGIHSSEPNGWAGIHGSTGWGPTRPTTPTRASPRTGSTAHDLLRQPAVPEPNEPSQWAVPGPNEPNQWAVHESSEPNQWAVPESSKPNQWAVPESNEPNTIQPSEPNESDPIEPSQRARRPHQQRRSEQVGGGGNQVHMFNPYTDRHGAPPGHWCGGALCTMTWGRAVHCGRCVRCLDLCVICSETLLENGSSDQVHVWVQSRGSVCDALHSCICVVLHFHSCICVYVSTYVLFEHHWTGWSVRWVAAFVFCALSQQITHTQNTHQKTKKPKTKYQKIINAALGGKHSG